MQLYRALRNLRHDGAPVASGSHLHLGPEAPGLDFLLKAGYIVAETLDEEIEAAFPCAEDIADMSKAEALKYAKTLGVDDIPGNVQAVRDELTKIVGQLKSVLYNDKRELSAKGAQATASEPPAASAPQGAATASTAPVASDVPATAAPAPAVTTPAAPAAQ